MMTETVQLTYEHCYIDFVFSERELMFMFAICRRPSVCRLSSVMLVTKFNATGLIAYAIKRLKFSAMFLRHLVPWPSVTLR